MNLQQIQSKITSMEIDVLKAVQQRTLEKYTAGPSVEQARLFFLLLPFFDGKQWSGKIEASAKTVSIVYAALHAHDQVKEDAPVTKKQQLTVLAGDFYSGIYYHMLTNLKNIPLIQRIATAIVQVSERKASFYEEAVRSIVDIDETVEVIETELLTAFYDFYGYDEYTPLAKLTLNYLRYAEELECLQRDGQTHVLRLLKQSLRHELHTENWLLEKLDHLHSQIVKCVNGYAFDYELKHFVLHQITPHQHRAEQLTREG
ncbi:heptaprenyl diphosphate synthase component 1 [Planomicrobium sp. CPCC 101110]|uniref:heptaprenyl diphosphate synthase component 1 n=1 Tax=Planomicrobium sp. CPCC 101110 TaxID=2599619 RepID=UPI0011B6F77F|nr:heptaprenyl diphosphate synthase component 1 [Planomicrobium sp. CPCC 101110]TWT28310.1 heptaprenyl diphosphate synthase [Planomicrobium sp. CPCC 101110]